jgi:hypothetical protein
MKKLLLLLFSSVFLACNSSNISSNLNNSNQSNLNQSNSNSSIPVAPAMKQEALSPEGKVFESLTSDSNYFDVIKLLGTPYAETNLPDLNLPLPLLLGCYQQNVCILLVNKDKPQEKDVKSNYIYVGALKVQPPEILHSADKKSLDLLEAIRTTVIKKMLQNAEKEVERKKTK